ncbi:TonB-dependent receptor [Sulfuriferula nivalis]|uniref:TonB-dependent receptor n=1 Tax=Sulfuriferula nivalis TaxID=2675298 RepID=A0A809RKE6_9PROT|nr:TonB-dependent receptor [Sulfuriferula nivalis]BBP02439.1 TonB-dependent receptor [Sulfuriferula nivalis]
MVFKHHTVWAAVSLAFPALAIADDVYQMPEVTVTAPSANTTLAASELSINDLAALKPSTSDTASLLRDMAGVSLNMGGGVSSLPAIHGMADDRLRVQVDGMDLIAACPNHMNSPLSYIDPTNVGAVKVYTGVTPVSVGGDSIGGSIQVASIDPQFATGADKLVTGQVGTYYRSNGNAQGANLSATMASASASIAYNGSVATSDNYTAGGDFKKAGLAATGKEYLDGSTVGSTAYKSENQSLNLALRGENKLLELKLGFQHIPYEGYANQRMDMTGNDSTQINLHYKELYQWGALDARVYHEATQHEMNFGDDKQYQYGTAPGMPMNTEGKNTGVAIKADMALTSKDTLKIGSEYQQYRLNDWWPPSGTGMMMSPNTFENINNGQRDKFSLFGEWEKRWTPKWLSQFGIRSDSVFMNADAVQGYSAMYATDAANFNASDRSHVDHNFDLTALTRYTPDQMVSFELGYAQKTRSPNLYERYTWSYNSMAMIMNNFAGDGNGYVGNPYLKPEVAHTISTTMRLHDANKVQWGLQMTPYYTYVEDYIDAQRTATSSTANNVFVNLQYVNQTAQLFGMDISGHVLIAKSHAYGDFNLTGLLNYTRGENLTTGDNLYNIMPLNLKLALTQTMGKWRNTIETQFVAAKTDISQVRNEVKTGGYSLVNLRSSYEWKKVRLDVGIDNLFDKSYALPTGGAYVGQGQTMSINGIPWGIAMPGMGRSIYTGLNFKF